MGGKKISKIARGPRRVTRGGVVTVRRLKTTFSIFAGRYVAKMTGKSVFSNFFGKNHWKKKGLFFPTILSKKVFCPTLLNVVLKKKLEKPFFPKKTLHNVQPDERGESSTSSTQY